MAFPNFVIAIREVRILYLFAYMHEDTRNVSAIKILSTAKRVS